MLGQVPISVRCKLKSFLGLSAVGALLAGSGFAVPAKAANENDLVLTNAAQIRGLGTGEASRHPPARLHGVVIMEGGDSLVLADGTAGIYLEQTKGLLSHFLEGDELSVTGTVDPGKFAPILEVSSATKTGTGKIPAPELVTFPELQTGRFDAQWIEVTGVVRRSGPASESIWKLWVAAGGGQLPVRLSRQQGESLAVDSEVRLRGICFYQFNKARQVVNPVLQIPVHQPVLVTRPAPAEPFAVAQRSISSLMQFNAEDLFIHRVRVSGVVTHAVLGEGFWIHSGEQGLRVHSFQQEPLAVGDRVDVLGFLSRGAYSPVMEDAIFRKQGKARPPLPLPLPGSQQALDHDEDLVQLEAQVLEQRPILDGCRLTLKDGGEPFSALLRLSEKTSAPKSWQPGSRVRIVGICSVTAGPKDAIAAGTLDPGAFQILLRSPADITILQPPPWWTLEHVTWVLGFSLGVVAVALLVVFLIARHRLRQQAVARMKSEAEFAAVWNERNRMAREMHDTLAQGLSAISMQLEVVKRQLPPEAKAREPLEVARRLARANMTEARNAIWNVRSQVLETGDLATALGDILRNLTEGTETRGGLRVRGKLRRLPPVTENNLLRIGQEAITNAVKYAQAKNILVALDFEARQLRLSVSDDGKGFNVQSPPPSEGGFGLTGMRERAAQLHAEFSVVSEPGEGTIVTQALPLLIDDRHS
jgi:signal transduction histidine kinase